MTPAFGRGAEAPRYGCLLGCQQPFDAAQLFSVTPNDPVTFGAVAIGLTAIAILATLVPARRAASVDPTKALHMN
jgi:hypothetical protein